MFFSQYLRGRHRAFELFPILLAIGIAWIGATVLTLAGVFAEGHPAHVSAEAVAAAGMDAKAQLARLDDRGDGGQKDQPSPRTPGPPPAGRRSLGRSPRPSADGLAATNLTQSVSRSSLSGTSRDPPLDPAVAKIPCLEDGTWTDVTYAVGGAKPRGRSGHASVRIGASEGYKVAADGVALPYQKVDRKWRCVNDAQSSIYNRVVDTRASTKDWTSAERD